MLDLAPDRVTMPTLGAVWRSILGAADFSVFIYGATGRFKTQLIAGLRRDVRSLAIIVDRCVTISSQPANRRFNGSYPGSLISEALKGIETSGQRIHEAELWRLRGELLGLRSGAEAEAERSFQHALELAVRQQALSLELSAATSLSRFLGQRGRPDEAKSKLAPIIARFTEGFEDTDFKEAAAPLREVG